MKIEAENFALKVELEIETNHWREVVAKCQILDRLSLILNRPRRHVLDELSWQVEELRTRALAAEARLADAVATLERIVAAYEKSNPLRRADFHRPDCECLRCAIDYAHTITKGETP